MEEKQLKNILEFHQKWINKEPGGKRADLRGTDLRGTDLREADLWRANLRDADLRGANLRDANLWRADLRGANLRDANLRVSDLRGTDLREANLWRADLRGAGLLGANLWVSDLREANLRGANLDYSCWPLWCGSLGVRVCKRIAAQLAYHFCRLDCDDPEVIAAQNAIIPLANQFHRVDECGKLEPKERK